MAFMKPPIVPVVVSLNLEVVVAGNGFNFFLDQTGSLAPSGGLPIVLTFFLRNPRRKTLREIGGQRVDIGLIHFAQLTELGVGFLAVVQLEAILRERVANA